MVTIKTQTPTRNSYRARLKGGNMTPSAPSPGHDSQRVCRIPPQTHFSEENAKRGLGIRSMWPHRQFEGAACCAPTTEKPNHGSGFVEDALVVGFVGGDDVVGAEIFLGIEAGGLAHGAAAVGAGQDFDGVAGGFLPVAGFHRSEERRVGKE